MNSMQRRLPKPNRLLLLMLAGLSMPVLSTTPLADRPALGGGLKVPGNLALAVSVEFPTAISVAHPNRSYSAANEYVGYFDPYKCYEYQHSATVPADNYFFPVLLNAKTGSDPTKWVRTCTGARQWSGNFLNWATMQTIDPFRWALTGGYRFIDRSTSGVSPALTVLEKAVSTNQGGDANFPNSDIRDAALIAGATPFTSDRFRLSVRTRGVKMRFIVGGTDANDINVAATGVSAYEGGDVTAGRVLDLFVRVKVCDPAVGVEANCTKYPNGDYKPTGLLQQYSDRIAYSVFGYLNDDNNRRDGAALRSNQRFVGPLIPVPGSTPLDNPAKEWDPNTGVFYGNPHPTEATATNTLYGLGGTARAITNSGVINYLNKFGQLGVSGTYKTFDPVGELYYTALRYFKNLGNVPEWTNAGAADAATRAKWADGFPVVTDWADPIKYSCQRNAILGIGDVNSHADRNLPGATGSIEPAKPASVETDFDLSKPGRTTVDYTNKVGLLHGLGSGLGTRESYPSCCGGNGALMAGLAYYANTTDIRPGSLKNEEGKQTVQTYWLDVLEFTTFRPNNQFFLAAKYGGFKVPAEFSPMETATDIPKGLWYTTTEKVPGTTIDKPDNYFTASRPDQMVSGLINAFSKFDKDISENTTAATSALPQVAKTGNASYAASYKSEDWSGELQANRDSYDAASGIVTSTPAWTFSTRLAAQALANTRYIASYDPVARKGVPFTKDGLPSTQYALLNTSFVSGDDSEDFLKYLRGDRTKELSAAGGVYRNRGKLVGDTINSRPRAVSAPAFPFADSANPGYGAFKEAMSKRPDVVYFGTNAGMLHAVDGTLDTTKGGGSELFAFVPSPVFAGPTGTPEVNGLQALGNPSFVHYNYVDAPPMMADVDLGRTGGTVGAPNWRTMLIGGLGKGGRSYYALDITDPRGIATDAQAASRVMWEFREDDLGYTYSEPVVVKTKHWGWVVLVGSGHNTPTGKGFIYIINPKTGAMLQKIPTGAGTPSVQAGLTAVNAFVPDATDGTADAIYAGDLLGNLWRVDLTTLSKPGGAVGGLPGYPDAQLVAVLTGSDGSPAPITAKPLGVVQPDTGTRWITVGTGRLLDESDIGRSQGQRFYAIMDGFNGAFWKPSELPAGFSYPIRATNLKARALSDIKSSISLDTTKEIGWFIELGSELGSGWRVIYDSSSYYGRVTFSAMLPVASDVACNASGRSRAFLMDLGTGSSKINTTEGFHSVDTGVIVELSVLSVEGTPRLYLGTNKGERVKPDADLKVDRQSRRLNWREIPTAR